MDVFIAFCALVLGSIFTTSVESAVQLTQPYNGKVVKRLLNSSVAFSWNFNGDFDFLTWGLKSRDTTVVNVTLVSLTKLRPVSISVPSQYVGRVSGEWNNNISPGQVTFTLSSIKLEDAALYACSVTPTDAAPDAEDYVELVVEDPPKAFPDEQVKSVDMGESASFIVSVTGTPLPNVTCYRNGTQVSGSQYEVIKIGANSSQFTVKNVSPVDHGYYDCQATTEGLKPASARFFLGVLKSVQEDRVLCPKRTYEAKIGDKVILCCPVSGYPPPEVEWMFDGVKVKKSLAAVLEIPSVEEKDYGSYFCTGKSLEGLVGPFSITLNKTKISTIEDVTNKRELGPGDKFEWTGVSGTEDYLIIIRIPPEVGSDTSLVGAGDKTSLEIPYSSLNIKSEDKKGRPVEVDIEVFAIVKSLIKGKGGPFPKTILNTASTPKVYFFSVFVLLSMALSLQ